MLASVSDLIRELQVIQGDKSDEEFARELGFTRQTWSAYKNGTRDISIEFLSAVKFKYRELDIQVYRAMDEIGRQKIERARL